MTTEKTEFEAMEVLDEEQIVNEMKGHVIDKYFYEFSGVVGISWAGIKWVSRKLSDQGHGIDICDLQTTSTNDAYEVIAIAQDINTKERRYGASTQAKMMQLRDGSEKPDPFALQKAISKAQRNAIRNFIPEIAIQEGYKEWKQRGQAPSTSSFHEYKEGKLVK